jgi:hypothetical protein
MEPLAPRRLMSASVLDFVAGDKHDVYDHLQPEAQTASLNILSQFGQRGKAGDAFAEADLNHDRRVTTTDFNLLARDLTPPRALPTEPVQAGVVVRYTVADDAGPNGSAGTTDFNLLAANFGGSNKRWFNADFNFDGSVNTTDFNLLAADAGASVSG